MASVLQMPQFGITMKEGTLTKWLVHEGSQIEKGMPIYEVETDKYNNVVESDIEGILLKIVAQEGDDIPVHGTVGIVGASGEDISNILPDYIQQVGQQNTEHDGQPTSAREAEQAKLPGVSILEMPQLGITMTEGTLTKWLVQEGDQISRGTPVYEVETDKYNNVVESEVEGTLLKIVAPEGTDVRVHGMVGIVGAPGTDISLLLTPQPRDSAPQAEPQSAPAVSAAPAPAGARVKASPLAKKTAKALGIDLSGVKGTGMDGRIVQADVLAAKESRRVPFDAVSDAVSGVDRTVRLSSMRRAISKNMSASWAVAPMVTYHTVVDMTELKYVKEKLAADQVRLSYTDLLTKIVAIALLKHPYVNCSLNGDTVTFHEYVNMGIAVALEDGLVVPVVKNAHLKGLAAISDELKALSEKARTGRLSEDDTAGGTFTISNLGMYGIDSFTPIVNQPQSAILGVNQIKKTAVEADGVIKMVPQMKLSLTADHRVIDGAEAARMLRDIRELAENPWKLFL